MTKPQVSVIVPVYNIPERYLEQCFQSLENQTLGDALEVLVIDDGSDKRECIDTCDRFADVFTVIHKQNEGVSIARNIGIEHARGEWIAFADSDDWCAPNMFEQLLERAQSAMVDIAVCDCTVEMRGKHVINHFYPQNESFAWNPTTKKNTILQIMGKNKVYNPPEIAIGVPWGKLYRKDFLLSNDLRFQPELKRMQDNIFNLNAFWAAKNVAYLKLPLYHYRKFENSRSNKYSPNVVAQFEPVLQYNKRFLDSIPYDPDLEQAYYARVIQSIQAYMKFWLYNDKNPMTDKQRKAEMFKILSNLPYKTALRRINNLKVNRSVAAFGIILRMHQFKLLAKAINARQQTRQAQS